MAASLEKALQELDDLIARLEAAPIAGPSPESVPGASGVSAPRQSQQVATAGSKADKSSPQKAEQSKIPIDRRAAGKNSTQAAGMSPLAETFVKAKLAVGRVQTAEELANSDKLYRCKVLVGNGEVVQVIGGLRKHVPQAELQGRLVVVVLNLKTAKLAGEESRGVILAAVHRGEQYELVKPISPPESSEVGDPVFLEGQPPPEAYPKEFKHWKKVLPHLSVAGSKASFEGSTLVTEHGPVTAHAAMPDGAAIS